MEKRLTPDQLTKIVGEVQRLSIYQEAELDRAEVQKILQELQLPPELLDEAMIQIQRKEALAKQNKKRLGMAIASITAIAITLAGLAFFSQQKTQSIANVSASQNRITLQSAPSSSLKTVNPGSPLAYRVTLSAAPVGTKLNLTCSWFDPVGQIAHKNSYETKEITTAVWDTQCRYALPVNAPVGNWQVKMLVGDRLLSQAQFDVRNPIAKARGL